MVPWLGRLLRAGQRCLDDAGLPPACLEGPRRPLRPWLALGTTSRGRYRLESGSKDESRRRAGAAVLLRRLDGWGGEVPGTAGP
jgi:hypothetical protein